MFTFFIVTMITALPTVQIYIDDWHDTQRNRTIPVRIFLPENTHPLPFPVILLSHGLGGNRNGFDYLGEDWSKHGYAVLVMQHPGSDSEVHADRQSGKTRLQVLAEAVSVKEAKNRVDDVSFILDELEQRNQQPKEHSDQKNDDSDPKLAGKLDLNRIGMGGHSFGSQTTLAVVGRLPYKAEPRLKAALVMSPNTPKEINPVLIHQNIKIPMLHLTGTNDRSPISKDFEPVERRIPFDSITATDQYLVIFKDGNHSLFSGHTRLFGLSVMEKKCQPVIAELTRRFFDAYLKNDIDAQKWLRGKGLEEYIQNLGTLDRK
ncbi:MAG: dienelactone hydrolase family protein [Planctomycetaceae bacterium]|jgi:predicted dienelactone hydrolase|nr:dienelactone hydrolase family protein [Planctomycetaceae bacterium]